MSTSYVNTSASNTAWGTSLSPSVPFSVNDDDILFAYIALSIGQAISSAPSGWASLGNDTAQKHYLYYKIASSESGSYTWTWGSDSKARIQIAAYRGGFDPGDPIDATSNTDYVTSDTTVRAASFSVTNTDSTIIFAGCGYGAAACTFTPPTNPGTFTEDVDAGDSSSDRYITFAHYEWPSSGATGDIDATFSTTTTTKHAFAVSLNLQIYNATPDGISFDYTFGAVEAEVKWADRTTYRALMENGGGDIAYLWHVAGYPWAVTDNPELITALSNTSNATVQAARKRLFGTNTWTLSTTITPAYTVPIFPGLIRDFGKSKWSMDESRGLLKGGDWKVKIEDRDHGHTWAHAVSGDEIWGLEGLHRIARIKESSVHGWGYLDENFTVTVGAGTPGELNINEETNNRLYNRIDGCSGDEWLPLWINHECVATSNVTGTAPSYEIGILGGAVAGGGRGLYRSRPQDHFTAVLKSLDPIVADVPGGVAGKYCWLYAIPLHEGSVMTRSDDEPIIAEIESGVITPNIRTRNSVTEVSIRGSMSSLEKSVDIKRSRATETSMAGFVFCRGDSGTAFTDADIIGNVQAPHLTIREWYQSWSSIMYKWVNASDPGELNDYIGGLLDQADEETNFSISYIWLCGKNQTVVFDTVQDVVDALNNELEACYNDVDGRFSEGTTLVHRHVVEYDSEINMYSLRSMDDDSGNRRILASGQQIEVNPSGFRQFPSWHVNRILYSKFTGPLSWVFYLGNPIVESSLGGGNMYHALRNCFNYQLLETVIPVHRGSTFLRGSYVYPYAEGGSDRYWMKERVDYSGSFIGEAFDWIESKLNYSESIAGAIPKYYISWDWIDNPVPNDFFDKSWEEMLVDGTPLQRVTTFQLPSSLWLPPGTNLDSFVDGEEITLGDGRRFPKLHATVDTLDDSDEHDIEELAVVGDLSVEPGYEIVGGSSLFYLPLLEYWKRDEGEIESIENLDAHYVNKALSLRTNTLSDIIGKILGDTAITSLDLAKELQQTQNPFFTTTGDFVSQIDWDSFDELTKMNGIYYDLDFENTDSIAKIFKNEILFHSAHMTREWDDSDQMWKFRFRSIGPPNKSEAWSLGYRLTEAKTQAGAPYETHGVGDLYNAIEFSIAAPAADYEATLEQKNASIVGTDERRTLGIKPSISRIYGLSFFTTDLLDHFINMLNAISTPSVVQTKKITTMQQLFPVGREILVTDSTSREPYTHARGLTTEPALVVGVTFDIAKQKGELSYRIGGPGESTTSGYSPSCYLTAGNFSKIVGEWSGTPVAHQFTSTRQANDVYYFDCFDLYDPSNPKARDCSCSDYKVWVHEQGTYNWTPLEFTCSVSASTGVITFTGDTTNIDTSKNYFVTFREWADLEDCQKVWCTHADDNNTIGTANLPAHRWV